jgi:hypothetical protein
MKYSTPLSPEKMIELAKRAVACKHWEWMPGMLALYDTRCDNPSCKPFSTSYIGFLPIYKDEPKGWIRTTGLPFPSELPQRLPDLRDPTTVLCMLHLVRKAWDEQGLYCAAHKGWWHVVWPDGEGDLDTDYADSEAEALVLALEAANEVD